MRFFSLLYSICIINYVQSLEPFDPWSTTDRTCTPTMDSCHFELRASSTMSMFYKQLYRVVAANDGTLHKFDNTSEIFSPEQIITADGYPKLVYVFNHSLPGPVIHVYQDQKVTVEIVNNLPTESLSVHFHGIRQYETPQSDGIGRLTQLSILPASNFQHEFTAIDLGTFWYHSHVNTQTSMGLVGAFVVHPRQPPVKKMREFVLVLKDWQHFYTGEQHQQLVESSQFYQNSLESLTSSGTIDYFEAVDGSRAAEALVTSILINGRGQYYDPRSNESSTSPFERLLMDPTDTQYRFRLINGGSTFSLKFSIDEHPLQVVAIDGMALAEPVTVDEIIIGLGERYEFVINVSANANANAWWIRVDTLDKNNNPRWHAKAILQFKSDSLVIPMSNQRNCTAETLCHVLNCPFSQYGDDTGRVCLTMKDLQTASEYLEEDLLSERTPINIRHSVSLTMVESDGEESGYESINYISMRYPKMKDPVLYNPALARETHPCTNRGNVSEDELGQRCYHHLVAQYSDIIEFLVVNYDSDQHPMHLHGSYFHVIEQGLAILNKTTGLFLDNNPNIACDQNGINCRCVNCSINTKLVKDTMIVPSGGYMRIRFRANNPGVWLFHCHTETHLDRGMALTIHVAEDKIAKLLHSSSLKHRGHGFWILSMLILLAVNFRL